MKLNCGPDYFTRLERKTAALQQWHRRFAWWPVRVSPEQCAWLQIVERRQWHGTYFWHTEYRLPVRDSAR